LLQSTQLLQRTQYQNLRRALYLSLLLCLITGLFLLAYGKTGSFLIVNGAHNTALDVLFRYGTYLGDGLIYVPLLVYCIFFNRSFLMPAVLSILICLLLTHLLKRVVFPDLLRPISLEAQHITIHKIQGVYVNRKNSFPSGHTATAFSTALLLAAVVKKRSWAYLVPLLAFLVAYSRVYLAQHFVSDVLGGMVIGILTALLALWLYALLKPKLPKWTHENRKRTAAG
jgi:membrane-associated phospholipid phosphatase